MAEGLVQDLDALKERISTDQFTDDLRMGLRFNWEAYRQLTADLTALKQIWSGCELVDRELAGNLYVSPQIIKNMKIMISGKKSILKGADYDDLEDAWTALDSLTVDCYGIGPYRCCGETFIEGHHRDPVTTDDQPREPAALKERIVRNRFACLLRTNSQFDRDAYDQLMADLKKLKEIWNSRTLIDPEIAGYLYIAAQTLDDATHTSRNEAAQAHGADLDHLINAWADLDDLITRCFYGDPHQFPSPTRMIAAEEG